MDSRFGRSILKMFSAALIWAVHFAVIYSFTALACARGFSDLEWLGVGMVTWVIGTATSIAIAALAVIIKRTLGAVRTTPSNTARFMHWMTAAIGGLALVAIVLEALPVLVVPACNRNIALGSPPIHLRVYR